MRHLALQKYQDPWYNYS